jgi:hypothetical protein
MAKRRAIATGAAFLALVALGLACLGRSPSGGDAPPAVRQDQRAPALPVPPSPPCVGGPCSDGGRPAAAPRRGADPHGRRAPDALIDTYASLSAAAENGDRDAALRLASELERCLARNETKVEFDTVAMFADFPFTCGNPAQCRHLDATYEQFQASLKDAEAAAGLCAEVPVAWLQTRGHWLERAAESGDWQARACYAVVGPEVGPSQEWPGGADWMRRWQERALPWAWEAFEHGEPRAAVALARIYAHEQLWYSDLGRIGEPDAALEYRFNAYLVRRFGLAADSEFADRAQAAAALLDADARRDADADLETDLRRDAGRTPAPDHTPGRCLGEFAGLP